MIIEILVISLVEDYVISCYNHLARGDYSRSTNFQMAAWQFVDVSEEEINTMKEMQFRKGDTFRRQDMEVFMVIVIKEKRVNCSGDVVDVNTNINENNKLKSHKFS